MPIIKINNFSALYKDYLAPTDGIFTSLQVNDSMMADFVNEETFMNFPRSYFHLLEKNESSYKKFSKDIWSASSHLCVIHCATRYTPE